MEVYLRGHGISKNNKLKMTREILPVIFKIVDSRQSGPKNRMLKLYL